MKLTDKQKKFCNEYLIDLNATQAAIRAGYSKKTADIIGHENLRKPNIEKYIKERQDKAQERNEITLDNIVKLVYEDALNGEHENNRLKAKDMLMKHLGGYTADNKLDVTAQIKRTIIVNPTKSKSE